MAKEVMRKDLHRHLCLSIAQSVTTRKNYTDTSVCL